MLDDVELTDFSFFTSEDCIDVVTEFDPVVVIHETGDQSTGRSPLAPLSNGEVQASTSDPREQPRPGPRDQRVLREEEERRGPSELNASRRIRHAAPLAARTP